MMQIILTMLLMQIKLILINLFPLKVNTIFVPELPELRNKLFTKCYTEGGNNSYRFIQQTLLAVLITQF